MLRNAVGVEINSNRRGGKARWVGRVLLKILGVFFLDEC